MDGVLCVYLLYLTNHNIDNAHVAQWCKYMIMINRYDRRETKKDTLFASIKYELILI